jgi:predicted TIM-barrel enzyme
MSIAAGTRLGRYEMRSKIGAGGMGEVYLVEDTRLHRKVALKILPADGVIVSGIATGEPADRLEVANVAGALSVPTLVGSGITAENIGKFSQADGLIVGSSIKKDGPWANPIDLERTRAVVRAFKANH